MPVVVEIYDPRVPISKLFREFQDLLGYFYPDGIALTALEKTEAAEQFIAWKDSLNLPYQMGVMGGEVLDASVNLLVFERWFADDLLSVIHSILSNRLLDHKFQRPLALKKRMSDSILNSFDSIPPFQDAYSLDLTNTRLNSLISVKSEGWNNPRGRIQRNLFVDAQRDDISNSERFALDTDLRSSHNVTSAKSDGWRGKSVKEVVLSDIYDNDPVAREEFTRDNIRGSMLSLNFMTTERGRSSIKPDEPIVLSNIYDDIPLKREALTRDLTRGSMRSLNFVTTEGKKIPLRPMVESTSEKSNSSTKMSYFGITEGKKSPLKPNKPIETKKL